MPFAVTQSLYFCYLHIKKMIVYPNAKINIGLFITEKRSDGFHNIESCFFPISLHDILEILPSSAPTSFSSSGLNIPGNPDDNLCLKAWQLLKEDFDIPFVKIHLHKQIPIGAGLGGGSADGAFTFKALNDLFNLNLDFSLLESYASKLGSDCTFFIRNKPAFATEKGEKLEFLSLSNMDKYNLLLVNPGIHISTVEAYSGITPNKARVYLPEIIKHDISDWQENISNDFEKSIFIKHPEIEEIKNSFLKNNASFTSMSGSGSSVFGVFKDYIPKKIIEQYKEMFIWQGKILSA